MLKLKNLLIILALSPFLLCLSCGDGPESPDDIIETETITDIDGNVYQTIQIGDQLWMAENLKVTRYRNGDPIIHETDNSAWLGQKSGAYCTYDNDNGNVDKYGLLYNWYAVVDTRRIAPSGWHVPTDAEWKELELHLGMSQTEANNTGWRGSGEGSKLKAASSWNYNGNGTNESGFSALAGGYRSYFGTFNDIGSRAEFWADSQSNTGHIWTRSLIYSSQKVYRFDGNRGRGFAIRLIKDTYIPDLD